MHASGTFEVRSGGEDAYETLDDGTKLTHAHGSQAFHGDVEGDGAVHWLMLYRTDRTATFVGLQRISGSIHGHAGSVVFTASGDHDGTGSRIELRVVVGSGSGALAGMTGSGHLVTPSGPTGTYELDYELGA
jgi:hypothetical protein